MKRVLFVCLGNICRSPLAEAILRRQVSEVQAPISVDSAGTGDWHVGKRSDYRAIKVGEAHGYEMNHLGRQVQPRDFQDFDLIIAMDHENLANLRRWPGAIPEKIRLARSFDALAESEVVPDPYYGTEAEFEAIIEQLEPACRGILRFLVDEA